MSTSRLRGWTRRAERASKRGEVVGVVADEVVIVTIRENELPIVWENAKRASLGGRSEVRNRTDRKENLDVDQMVGQLGECALALCMTGNINAYVQHRKECNEHPELGDKGIDLPGLRIDVKTSLLRYPEIYPEDYHLFGRPRERHDGHTYVFALIPTPRKAPDEDPRDWLLRQKEIAVLFVGWAYENELPDEAGYCFHCKKHFFDWEADPPFVLHGTVLTRMIGPKHV